MQQLSSATFLELRPLICLPAQCSLALLMPVRRAKSPTKQTRPTIVREVLRNSAAPATLLHFVATMMTMVSKLFGLTALRQTISMAGQSAGERSEYG